MSGARIRTAEAGDLAAVRAIYAHHVRHGKANFELEPPDEAEMARRMAEARTRGTPHIVAEMEGTVRGFGAIGPYRPRPAYQWTAEHSVYVAPDMLRHGLGRMLLAELIRRAELAGYRQMIAVIGDTANAASIGLHAALGFRHAGVFTAVGFKNGRWLDTVLMQRALGAGATTPPDR